jgi:hypothetical protein
VPPLGELDPRGADNLARACTQPLSELEAAIFPRSRENAGMASAPISSACITADRFERRSGASSGAPFAREKGRLSTRAAKSNFPTRKRRDDFGTQEGGLKSHGSYSPSRLARQCGARA